MTRSPDFAEHPEPDSMPQPPQVPQDPQSGLRAGAPAARAILAVCPAGVYREQGDRVLADDAACLECGACLAVVADGLRWAYPRGGQGVHFRQG